MHQLHLPELILPNPPSAKDLLKGAVMQTSPKQADAIFRLCAKTIKRSDGRSALACVAYRAGCEMFGQDGSSVADYRRRKGVVGSKIVAPIQAPAWALNRNEMWLRATAKEVRINSVEAREFEIAIPRGAGKDDALELAEQFAEEIVARHACVVDFSLHADSRKDWTGAAKNFEGFHVHFLLTTRRIGETGFGEKTRELDERNSGLISFWRKRWEELSNAFFALNGNGITIDSRTNAARGIGREASHPLGPKVVALERSGKRTKRGDDVRAIFGVPPSAAVHE